MKFVIAGIFIKNILKGFNIQGDLEIIEANSIEEAVGEYVMKISKKIP